MATRLKTIEYVFSELSAATDNTDTNFTQITIDIPETVVSFRSVHLEVMWGYSPLDNTTRRQLSMRLGSNAYTSVNNTSTITDSGENQWLQMGALFTDYFNTNWSGTSMTCDARVLINSTTDDIRSVTARLKITYSFDDTATTQVKTVRLPLFTDYNALSTSKPGTANDTIPALDSWLPENSISIKQMSIIVQGNEETTSTTDMDLSMQIDSGTSYTSPTHENNSACGRWYRHIWLLSFDTSTTHNFYIWASQADFDHPQAWLNITYTFNASATTTVLNSLVLPMEFNSPAGGPTSADWQRAERDLWVSEPNTITLKESALYVNWDQRAAIAGLAMRIGSNAFQAISSVTNVAAGGFGCMLPDVQDVYTSFGRGKNTFVADIYRTDLVDLCWNLSSWWLINYTSGVSSKGLNAHNHSVCKTLFTHDTTSPDNNRTTTELNADIPENYWFMNSIGINYIYLTNTSGNPSGVTVQTERLTSEGGLAWEPLYSDISETDPEVGVRQSWSTSRNIFKRWSQDNFSNRLSIQVNRRYKSYLNLNAQSWDILDLWMTYHTITFDVSGSLSGYSGDGSNISVTFYRSGSNETVLNITSSAGGNFSDKWYDNTLPLFAEAYEDETHVGRSAYSTGSGAP
jgi:hypothetical protein